MATQITLASADRLYAASASLQLHRIPVPHRLFKAFGTARRRFLKRLGEAAGDPYWVEFCRWLSRFHFRAMVTPLPFHHPALYLVVDAARFRQHLATSEMLYPGISDEALALLNQVEQLAGTGEKPLLHGLLRLLRDLDDLTGTALVVRDSATCDPLEALLKEHGITRLELISVPQLRERPFRRLIVTGPAHWFPTHLFAAPRAPEVYLLHYDWASGRPRLEPVFAAPQPEGAQQAAPEPEAVDPEEDLFLPGSIDVNQYLHQPGAGGNVGSPAEPTELNARLFLLEDQKGLFLEADSTTLVIDAEAAGIKRVVRKAVTNVDPGMFLLVKQGGGGDYIVPIADSLLGDQAAMARATQRRWKEMLRALVTERGFPGARVRLLECGGLRPNEWNLRNWMAVSSIRPWAFEDLAAILMVAGQADQAEECWRVMGAIDTAHSRAGQLLRRQLLRQVTQTDLQRLQRNGRMEFTVDVASEVRMVALRVLKVLPGPFRVPASRLSSPFDVEERYAWLG